MPSYPAAPVPASSSTSVVYVTQVQTIVPLPVATYSAAACSGAACAANPGCMGTECPNASGISLAGAIVASATANPGCMGAECPMVSGTSLAGAVGASSTAKPTYEQSSKASSATVSGVGIAVAALVIGVLAAM
jgi:hypothetical protein